MPLERELHLVDQLGQLLDPHLLPELYLLLLEKKRLDPHLLPSLLQLDLLPELLKLLLVLQRVLQSDQLLVEM